MLFLCHSSKDKLIVRRVAKAIKATGIPVWLDEERINYGDNIVTKLSQGLADSQLILVFLSKHFLESEWVKQEWSTLFCEEVNQRVTKVIPVIIGDMPDELPAPIALLRAKKYVDLRGASADSSLAAFVEYLRAHTSSLSECKVATREKRVKRELQVRAEGRASGSLSVHYFLDGAAFTTTSVASRDLALALSNMTSQFPRLQFRFGDESTYAIETIAQRLSSFLIPPQVREQLQSDSIRRLQVLVGPDDPQLPWEIAHDGHDFVGLRIPIINTPIKDGDKHCGPFQPHGVVIVEGVPDTFGVQLDHFLARYLADIPLGDMEVARIQARTLEDLRRAMERHAYDIIHYAGHTVTSDDYLRFLIGDDCISVDGFCAALSNSGESKLVILDSCESARCFPYIEPSFKNNPAYLLALAGFHAVGSVGWLEMRTSDHFNEEFYRALTDCNCIEEVMLRAKRRLHAKGLDWWVFAHFGRTAA